MKFFYPLMGLIALTTVSVQAQDKEVLTNYPEVLDGSVEAIAIDEENDRIYLGGNFSQLRRSETISVPFLNSTALSEESTPLDLPEIDGEVFNIVGDGQGGVFVSGDFTKVGNFDRNGLAHINSNGQVTALSIAINGPVYDIRLDLENDVLYVGGDFSLVDGLERESLCALNSETFDVLSFDLLLNGPVYDIEQDADTLYIAGSFTGAGQLAKEFLIYDELAEQAIEPFDANGAITDVIDDGNNGFFLLGSFTMVGDSLRNGIAHVDSNGQPTAWNINLEANSPLGNLAVNSILLAGDTLYMGGSFNVVNGVTRRNLAAVNAQTGSLLPWNPKTKIINSSTFVYKIGFLNDSILVAGNFNRIDNEQIKYLALVDKVQGSVSLNFDAQLDEQVRNFEIQGNYLHLVGLFNEVLGVARERVCTIDLVNWDLPFAQIPIFSGGREDIVAVGDTIFLGGSFSRPGVSNARFGAFRRSTSEWIEMNLRTNGQVKDLELDGDKLYLGGWFRRLRSESREHFAAIDVHTLEVTDDAFSFTPSENFQGNIQGVEMVKKIGDRIYLSSTAKRVNEYRRPGFLAFSVSGEIDEITVPINITQLSTSSNQDFPFEGVHDIELVNDKIYLAGDFATSPQISFKFLVSADRYTGDLEGLGADTDLPVRSIAADDEKLYFTGEFTTVNGEATPLLSRIDLASNVVDEWPTPNFVEGNMIHDVIVTNGNVLIAGDFHSVGSVPRNNFAAFDKNSLELSDARPDPNDVVFAIYENNGTVIAGGAFTGFNLSPVLETEPNFVVIEKSTGEIVDLTSFPGGRVDDILLVDDKVLIAGKFTQFGGAPRSGIAAIDRISLQLTDWGSDLDAQNNNLRVYDLDVDEDRVYYAGKINYTGNNVLNFGALDRASGALLDWPAESLFSSAPPTNRFLSVEVADTSIFFGGRFEVTSSASGVYNNHLIEIGKIGGENTDIGYSEFSGSIFQVMGSISSMARFGEEFIVCGKTYALGEGVTKFNFANTAPQWLPWASLGSTGKDPFLDEYRVEGKEIVIKDSLLHFASEAFVGTYSFASQNYVSTYSDDSWYDDVFEGDRMKWVPIYTASAIAVDSAGTVYVGGDFVNIAGTPRSGFAVIVDGEEACDPEDAGTVSTASVTRDICLNNELLDIVQAEVTGNTGNSAFILHDAGYNVFSVRQTGTFKPDNHPPGNYFVSHVAYTGDLGQTSNLNDFDGCVAFSNTFAVTSFRADAGSISTADPKNYCAADLPATITFDRVNSSGPNQGFALVNGSNQIIEISLDGSFVLDGFAVGNYKVASLSTYETVILEDIQVGNFDPCFDYSNVIKVKIQACEELLVSSSPNPATDVSNVTFTTVGEENVQLELFDLSGKSIALIYSGAAKGQIPYRFQFDTSDLPSGVYIYRLNTGAETKTVKFLKN